MMTLTIAERGSANDLNIQNDNRNHFVFEFRGEKKPKRKTEKIRNRNER